MRALHDAGLDLEDNGLTFTLNDPAGDQGKNQQGNAQAQNGGKHGALKLGADNLAETADAAIQSAKTAKPNDPFQSWQRARIALTA
jgi:flagellar hook-length control protein FliK